MLEWNKCQWWQDLCLVASTWGIIGILSEGGQTLVIDGRSIRGGSMQYRTEQ
jgi:hypothetical protein